MNRIGRWRGPVARALYLSERRDGFAVESGADEDIGLFQRFVHLRPAQSGPHTGRRGVLRSEDFSVGAH